MKAQYWPCAPDGFIPNSIVRENYCVRNTTVVREEQWKPPEWKAEWGEYYQRGRSTDEGSEDRIRTWLSDDDDETDVSSAFSTNNHRSRFSSNMSDQPTTVKQNEVMGKHLGGIKEVDSLPRIMADARNDVISSSEKKTLRWMNENISGDIDLKGTGIDGHGKTEGDTDLGNLHGRMKLNLPPINDEQDVDGTQLIPYPFLKYYKKAWFPKEIGYEVARVCEALIRSLQTCGTGDLMDVLQCIIKAHRFSSLKPKDLKELISHILELLDNDDPLVRQYAAQAFRELGINREKIVIKLIQKLDDQSRDVREEVKKTLKEIAGIVDASTLTAVLQGYGKYKEMDTSSDTNVITSLQEHIVTRRDSFKARIHQLYRNYGEDDKKMLGIFDVTKQPGVKLPKIRKKEEKQVPDETDISSRNDCISVTITEKDLSALRGETLLVDTPDQEEDTISSQHSVERIRQQPMNIAESLGNNKRKTKRKNETLERLTLSATIKALREKRLNSNFTAQNELVDIFQDISLLFEFLETNNEKRNSVLKKKMAEVHEINERLLAFERDDMEQGKVQRTVKRLIPSSICQNMEPGVTGERILIGFHVLPKIHQSTEDSIRSRMIKAIPERNGCVTAEKHGNTNYGKMGYHWTTYTSYYDFGVNLRNRLKKQYMHDDDSEHITHKNDRFGEFNVRKPSRTKRQNTNICDVTSNLRSPPVKYKLNTKTILPKIKRELNRCDNRPVANPMLLSIAEATVI